MSEYRNPPRDVPWREAGPGAAFTIRCDTCGKTKTRTGAKLFRAMWKCTDCRNELLKKESMDQPA